MNIQISPYTLVPKKSLNPSSKKNLVEGFLLKFNFADEGIGYSVLQTWPHLGEPKINECLKDLKEEQKLDISKNTIALAKWDALSRSKKESLFDAKEALDNYYSLGELDDLSAIPKSFHTIKWKWPKEIDTFKKNKEILKNYLSKIDFNHTRPPFFDEGLLEGLKIDYLEDVAFKTTYTIAEDFKKNLPQACPFVFKPSREYLFLENFKPKNRCIFTSNMDHPLGQMVAACYAQKFYKKHPALKEQAGLLSHFLFEDNVYSEALNIKENRLYGVEGSGFGFDELLEKEKWQKL